MDSASNIVNTFTPVQLRPPFLLLKAGLPTGFLHPTISIISLHGTSKPCLSPGPLQSTGNSGLRAPVTPHTLLLLGRQWLAARRYWRSADRSGSSRRTGSSRPIRGPIRSSAGRVSADDWNWLAVRYCIRGRGQRGTASLALGINMIPTHI